MIETKNYKFKKTEGNEPVNFNNINDSLDLVDEKLKEVEDSNKTLSTTFDGLIINAGNSNAEVVEARGGEAKLATRLDKVDTQLAENTNEINLLETQVTSLASGSPKGVYPTILDLQSAYPTGNTNIYVVTADGNWYYWNGSKWTSGGIYQSTEIANRSVTPEKLDRTYVLGKAKDNMIDLSLYYENKYYDSAISGGLSTGNGTTFSLPIIKLEVGQTYTLDLAGLFSYAFFDSNKTYTTGGLKATFTNPFVATSDKMYIGLSLFNTSKNTFMMVKGNTLPSSYVPYVIVPLNYQNRYVVGHGADCDYSTIKDAINSITDDSPTKQYTIVLKSGIYNEVISLINRYISIKGECKNNTIIATYTGKYSDAPLMVGGGNAYFENITFLANHDNLYSGYEVDTNYAYAVHADFGSVGKIEFFNCDLISYQSCALGAGLFTNQKMLFRNCKLESIYSDVMPVSDTGAMLLHSSSVVGSTNQNAEFDNCTFIATGRTYVLRLMRTATDMNVLFKNCYGKSPSNTILISDNLNEPITLDLIDSASFGNNIPELNKSSIGNYITPTLINSWVEYDTGSTPRFKKDTLGRVQLEGAVKGGTLGTAVFNLPEGYRPKRTMRFNGYNNSFMYITSTGDVYIQSYTTMAVLDEISFLVI